MATLTIAFIFLSLILSSYGQLYQPRDITNAEFIQYYISGAALSYQIDVTKCKQKANLKNMTVYSFTEDIDRGILSIYKDAQWEMNFGVQRQVDGQRLNLTGAAFHFSEFSLFNSGKVILGLIAINPVNYEYLAQAEVDCQMDQGNTSGLRVVATSPPGTALSNFVQPQTALNVGYSLYYAIDIYQCQPVPSDPGHQWIAGRLTGVRYDPNGDIRFTVRTEDLGYINVYLVLVKPDDSVPVELYVYDKTKRSSFHYQYKNCTLGAQDTVRIFRQ